MEIAGVRGAAGLRALPVERVLKAVQQAKISFAPVQDGETIRLDPLTAIAAGAAAGIPLLAGTNKDEFRYWIMTRQSKTATVEQMIENFPDSRIDLGHRMRTVMAH